MAASAVLKIEQDVETCCLCGNTGELLSPEEHDTNTAPMQMPLRAMLLHLNNNKVVPEGRMCGDCIRRAIESYEFSSSLSSKGVPPLSEKIRALRRRLHELTQKIDVFIVVGGPGANAGGTYSEDDIIMVEKDALAAAAAADDEDMERARNARGDTVYQCSVCPHSFQCVWELRRHEGTCAGACPGCGAWIGDRVALSAHVLSTHARESPCVCAACFRRLESPEALAAHMLRHRQAKQYVCGYDGCILRFGTRGNLMSHIRKCHAAAADDAPPAPTTCAVCARTFGSVAAMKRHARVHKRDQEQEVNDTKVEESAMDGLEEEVEYLEVETLEDPDYRDE
ncbi:hypothetical protein evm_012294 [Chilo suppressalis]|nr:hypothetical protein evm_012294 [Chilo suppressalis]